MRGLADEVPYGSEVRSGLANATTAAAMSMLLTRNDLGLLLFPPLTADFLTCHIAR